MIDKALEMVLLRDLLEEGTRSTWTLFDDNVLGDIHYEGYEEVVKGLLDGNKHQIIILPGNPYYITVSIKEVQDSE